ncbi:hypothetical protein AB0D49_39165 [Streptomyces sp. NPDC048290]|uniref:hypothetical protein n=1 Tax=Streptomyces sp. NPDC048290 TaxID=3155811 RepID=UPI0034372176
MPGLYFTGIHAAAPFGPLLRLSYGTVFGAPRLAAAPGDALHRVRRESARGGRRLVRGRPALRSAAGRTLKAVSALRTR